MITMITMIIMIIMIIMMIKKIILIKKVNSGSGNHVPRFLPENLYFVCYCYGEEFIITYLTQNNNKSYKSTVVQAK